MSRLDAGDVVRLAGTDYQMVIIGFADDEPQVDEVGGSWSCVWESEHYLFEEVFAAKDLILVQKERRCIPRGGNIDFPVRQESCELANSSSK